MIPICCGTIGSWISRLSLRIWASTDITLWEAVISHGGSRRGRETIKMGIIIRIGHGLWFDWAQQGLHPSSRHTISRVSGSTSAVGSVLPILLGLLLCLWLRPSLLSGRALCSARMPFFVGITVTKVAVCPPWMRFSSELANERLELRNSIPETRVFVKRRVISESGVIDFVNTETCQAELNTALTWSLSVALSFRCMTIQATLSGPISPPFPIFG
jgi:hypothetical protein